MPLLVFEFLGTTELLVIALVALIIFGPRKLPEIGRTIGRGMAEFKRASEDFKRTWEYEVEVERRQPAAEREGRAARGQLPEEGEAPAADDWTPAAEPAADYAETVARNPGGLVQPGDAAPADPPAGDAAPAEDLSAPERERV